MREIASYWFDVLREITSYWFDVQKRANFNFFLCYVQIPSQLFDLRAVCRGIMSYFLFHGIKLLNIFIISCLVSTVKYNNVYY